MGEELKANVRETFQAFQMTQDQENIPPLSQYQVPYDGRFGFVPPNLYETHTPTQNQMYATTQVPPPFQHLQKQLTSIQNQLQSLTLINLPHPTSAVTKDASKNDTINPKTGRPWQCYCWTCGCCTHWVRSCPQKKKGYRDEATFRNRMGGSNLNCR